MMNNKDSEPTTVISVNVTKSERHLLEDAAALFGLELEAYAHRALMLQTELNPDFKYIFTLTGNEFGELKKQLDEN